VSDFRNVIINDDALTALKSFPDNSIDCVVTSPPYYGLRDYGHGNQIGLEKSPQEYISKILTIFDQIMRVLKNEGTLWLNLGDTYIGGGNNRGNTSTLSNQQKSNRGAIGQVAQFGIHKFKSDFLKPKDLCGIPWRVALALQESGWYLRQDIIWHKPNPMPESVRDRCTKAHEYIFLLSKSPRYYFNHESILELASEVKRLGKTGPRSATPLTAMRNDRSNSGGFTPRFEGTGNKPVRNKRSVWTVATKPFRGAHFATFPPDLIEPCILAGCPSGGIVLDPFFGSGTVGLVAKKHGRNYVGIEINSEYVKIAHERLVSKNR
jgi:DNA modification methylase